MSATSPELLCRLVQAQGPALVLYARQFCDSPEDVVQEVFLELFRQQPAPDQPTAWLFRVVRNRALNAARSTARRARHERGAAAQRGGWFTEEAGSRIDAIAADAALRRLPAEQREVVIARIWGGLSLKQVADLIGASPATALRRYQAGLESLRERMGIACPQTDSIQPTGATNESTNRR